MKVYYAPNTRAVRIVWLLEELGLDYEIERFRLGDKSMREPGYLAVHPMGRVPALEDGDVTMFESGAIVEYILARHGGGRLIPETASADFPEYLQWLHYSEGMIMPPVNTIVVETMLLPPERRNQGNADRAVKLLGPDAERGGNAAGGTGVPGRRFQRCRYHDGACLHRGGAARRRHLRQAERRGLHRTAAGAPGAEEGLGGLSDPDASTL